MLVYPSGVDVPRSSLRFLAQHLRGHHRVIGSRWRRLNSGRQALLALAHLRVGHTYAQFATGFGIGTTTAHCYVAEAVDLPAALAATLAEAARAASMKAFVLLDGTLLPIDRIAADRPFYSGKHRKHCMDVQVLADPFGRLLWASPALPGAVHNVRAAREHGVMDALAAVDVTCWADKGYRGAGGTIRIPYWGRWHTPLHRSAGGEPVPREDPRPGGTGHGPPQVLAPSAQDPTLHDPHHRTRPSRPHPAPGQLRARMEKAQ